MSQGTQRRFTVVLERAGAWQVRGVAVELAAARGDQALERDVLLDPSETPSGMRAMKTGLLSKKTVNCGPGRYAT